MRLKSRRNQLNNIELYKAIFDQLCPAGWEQDLWVRGCMTIEEQLKAREAKEPEVSDRDRALEILNDLLYCDRTWSAWSCGTMREDDFYVASEDEDIIANTEAVITAVRAEAARNERERYVAVLRMAKQFAAWMCRRAILTDDEEQEMSAEALIAEITAILSPKSASDEHQKIQASAQVVTDNTETLKAALERIEELEGKVVKWRRRAEALAKALKPFADIGNSIPSEGEFGITIIFSDYKNAAEVFAKYQEDYPSC
jgi:hypothetical protein